MGLRSFFHKIKIGFTRMGKSSIPYTTQAKKYGDWGEDEFVYDIESRLSGCKIKKEYHHSNLGRKCRDRLYDTL